MYECLRQFYPLSFALAHLPWFPVCKTTQPELVEELAERRFADEYPETAEKIAELSAAGEFYEQVAGAAEQLIRETIPNADPAAISTSDGFEQSA